MNGRVVLLCSMVLASATGCDRGARMPTLTVFNAAALGPPLRDALVAFAGTPARLRIAQENAPSLDVVRKMTELGQTPDILAVADEVLMPTLVLPDHSRWYLRFGTNALFLAYGPRARYASEITTENWWSVLTRPGVEVGRSDLHRPSTPVREVPREIDLSAPELAARYAAAEVPLPRPGGLPPLVIRGAPIVFALTIPERESESALAIEFVRFLLSEDGRAAMRRSGFSPLDVPAFVGTPPAALQPLGAHTGVATR